MKNFTLHILLVEADDVFKALKENNDYDSCMWMKKDTEEEYIGGILSFVEQSIYDYCFPFPFDHMTEKYNKLMESSHITLVSDISYEYSLNIPITDIIKKRLKYYIDNKDKERELINKGSIFITSFVKAIIYTFYNSMYKECEGVAVYIKYEKE